MKRSKKTTHSTAEDKANENGLNKLKLKTKEKKTYNHLDDDDFEMAFDDDLSSLDDLEIDEDEF